MADGTPKISDFGLAKQLDSEQGQTRSGTILGTPQYMAPEQAMGRTRTIANISLGDHTDSELGLIASGYTAGSTTGNHYVTVNATGFATTNLSLYSAIFVPSDHGGILTGDDLNALNARAGDILNYLVAGGGLVAFAEDGFRTGPPATNFGFLPFSLGDVAFSQGEVGFTLTAAGTALGLVTSDINGNASHTVFTATGGLDVVDLDAHGQIISLAGQVVPEPGSMALLAIGALGLVGYGWRRRQRLA